MRDQLFGPLKIIFLLLATLLSFITSGWLLAKQGKILAWAPIQGQGDNFNEFHWELAKWASVPFVFSILCKPGSLTIESCCCVSVWCVLFCFSPTLYFSGAWLEIFWHLAQWHNFFYALGWGNKFACCCSSVCFLCSQMVTLLSHSCLF